MLRSAARIVCLDAAACCCLLATSTDGVSDGDYLARLFEDILFRELQNTRAIYDGSW